MLKYPFLARYTNELTVHGARLFSRSTTTVPWLVTMVAWLFAEESGLAGGVPPEQAVKAADVKIPLQGHFANKDDYITPKTVDDFEKALKAAGKDAEFFRYDADHAFVNEQRMAVHDRQAAELAWGRAVAFLKKRLG